MPIKSRGIGKGGKRPGSGRPKSHATIRKERKQYLAKATSYEEAVKFHNFLEELDSDKSPADTDPYWDKNAAGKSTVNGKKYKKIIATRASFAKLQELGIDPLEEIIQLYKEVMEDAKNTRSISAKSALYNIASACHRDLMKYAYAPIPIDSKETHVIEDKRGPMAVTLTEGKEQFSLEDMQNQPVKSEYTKKVH